MKKLFVLILLCISIHSVNAFHIVGGEFQLVHLEENMYRLNFYMYFDRFQSDNPNPESFISVNIFENASEKLTENFVLAFMREEQLDAGRDDCRVDLLNVSRVTYSLDINLSQDIYSHPDGYHIVWERCCRNDGIVNLQNPLGTGATFVMYFPPVVSDSEPLANTSPLINAPDLNYACVGQLYQSDLTAFDADGDSLAYSLVVPLNSSAAVPVPIPVSQSSHMPVVLASGLDSSILIPGNPNLQINRDGEISVVASDPGFYAYGIEVREYRDGALIGSVMRDYQLLVLDGCVPPANIANTAVRVSENGTFFEESISADFDQMSENCVDFLLVTNSGSDFSETSVELIPADFGEGIFFDLDSAGILIETNTISEDSTLYEICFPQCSFSSSGKYTFDLIGKVDNCSVVDSDTVRLEVDFLMQTEESGAFESEEKEVGVNIGVDETYQATFKVLNYNSENLSVELIDLEGNNIDFDAAGLTINTFSPSDNVLDVTVNWEPSCAESIDLIGVGYQIGLILNDALFCESIRDMISLDLSLNGISAPYFNEFDSGFFAFETGINQTIRKEIEILDDDRDEIAIALEVLKPADATFDQLGINFSIIDSNMGTAKAILEWTPDCGKFDFNASSEIKLKISVDDLDFCESPAVSYEINGEIISSGASICVVTEVAEQQIADFNIQRLGRNNLTFTHPASELKVAIYDMTGRVIFLEDITSTGPIYDIAVNLNQNQVYVLKVGDKVIKFVSN